MGFKDQLLWKPWDGNEWKTRPMRRGNFVMGDSFLFISPTTKTTEHTFIKISLYFPQLFWMALNCISRNSHRTCDLEIFYKLFFLNYSNEMMILEQAMWEVVWVSVYTGVGILCFTVKNRTSFLVNINVNFTLSANKLILDNYILQKKNLNLQEGNDKSPSI